MFTGYTILAFHQCSNRYYPGINNIRPDKFRAFLNLLKSWGFVFWNGGEAAPDADHPSQIVITFDDGFADQFDLLMRLRSDEIKPVVFIPAAFIGKRNRWEYYSRFFPADHLDSGQLRKLAEAGIIIGSHGYSHLSLANMSEDLIGQELVRSRDTIEAATGFPVDLFSFPFGRTNDTVNRLATEAGYRHGFILEYDGRAGEADEFILPRIPVYSIDNYFSLKARLLRDSALVKLRNRVINRLAGGTIIISRKAQINRSRSENS